MTKQELLQRMLLVENLREQADKVVETIRAEFANEQEYQRVEEMVKGEKKFSVLYQYLSDAGLLANMEDDDDKPGYPKLEINKDNPRQIDLLVWAYGGQLIKAYTMEEDYGTLQVGLIQADQNGTDIRDIAMAEIPRRELAKLEGKRPDNHDIIVRVWGDPEANDYTDRFEVPEAQPWYCTDPDMFQHARLSRYMENPVPFGIVDFVEERWDYIQADEMPDGTYIVRINRGMKLSDFDSITAEMCVEGFYPGGIDQVMKEYPKDWQQIILECIFESQTPEQSDFAYRADDEEAVNSIIYALQNDLEVRA